MNFWVNYPDARFGFGFDWLPSLLLGLLNADSKAYLLYSSAMDFSSFVFWVQKLMEGVD